MKIFWSNSNKNTYSMWNTLWNVILISHIKQHILFANKTSIPINLKDNLYLPPHPDQPAVVFPRDPFAEKRKHPPSPPKQTLPQHITQKWGEKNGAEKITSRRALPKQTGERNTPQRVKKKGGQRVQFPWGITTPPTPPIRNWERRWKSFRSRHRRMEGSPNP